MKKSVFILFVLFVCNSVMYCQVEKDSLGSNYIYPSFQDDFSAEESWEIHKAAFVKQLESSGLSDDEIQKQIADYEKNKNQFIQNVIKQRKMAEEQRKKVDEMRKQAKVLRKLARQQRKQADVLRKEAKAQKRQAEKLRTKADKQRKQANHQKQKDEKQEKMLAEQKKQAEKLRTQAAALRKQADILRKQAAEQRKQANVLRQEAEMSRNNFENIFSKKVTLSKDSPQVDPILFKVDKKTTLLFGIEGEINSGTALIEIINPNGEKQGRLSLEHNKNPDLKREEDSSNPTSGSLSKTISDSEVGDWQIIISHQKAEGNVNISIGQYINPTVDE